MTDLVAASLAWPTIVFSVGLGVCLVYWVVTLVTGGGDGSDAFDGVGDGDGVLGSLDDALGLGAVPLSVGASLLMAFAWFFSLVGTQLAGERGGALGVAAALVVAAVALVLGAVVTRFVARPLAVLYAHTPAQRQADLVGRIARVTTGRVDGGFGQAEVTDDEGAVLTVAVRCLDDSRLTRGAHALLFRFDDELDAFLVTRADDELLPPQES